MHEFALTEDLINLAVDEARKNGLVRLDRIVVSIGELSGINIDSIVFAYDILHLENPITEHAELVIERVEGRGRCGSCGKDVRLESLFLYCPECGQPIVS